MIEDLGAPLASTVRKAATAMWRIIFTTEHICPASRRRRSQTPICNTHDVLHDRGKVLRKFNNDKPHYIKELSLGITHRYRLSTALQIPTEYSWNTRTKIRIPPGISSLLEVVEARVVEQIEIPLVCRIFSGYPRNNRIEDFNE